MPKESDRASAVLELLGRIHAAAALPGALAPLLHLVHDTLGSPRAAALVESRGALCGISGVGVPNEAVRALALPLNQPHPLLDALAGGEEAVRVRVLDGDPLAPLGFESALALPLRRADGTGFGVLLADGDVGEADEMLREAVRHAGPALWRFAQVEALRREREEAERRYAMYESVGHALPDPVLITDAQRRIVLENRRARALFQAGDGDPEERRRVVGINNLLFSSFLARSLMGEAVSRDLNLVDPDTGADLRFEALSAALPEALAGDGMTVSLLRDVTDLKRASTELEHQLRRASQAEARSRRERDRLTLILESAGAPIVVTGEDGRVVLMNREAERLFERGEEVAADSPAGEAAAENETRFAEAVAELAGGQEARRTAQLQLSHPDTGADFPAEAVSSRLLDEQGRTAGIVSVLRDQSREVENARLADELSRVNEGLEERVREATRALQVRNAELEWQRRELERAYRLKSEFLASMSHELRTPINALLGYTSLMRDRLYGELTPRQEEALERMYRASDHLLELINDILDLAKIEAGKMPLHLEEVEVGVLLEELSGAVEPLVGQKELGFRLEVEEGLPVLLTDRMRVKQVLLNLLSNAVKFTHAGYVAVRARRLPDDGGVEVEVEDTGIGIAPDDLPTIFDDFRQVDQSSTREYGGTGLGLSIVRKLLGLLGGSVRVRSKAGEGAAFTVRLPLRSIPVEPGEEAVRAAMETKVLIEGGD